MSPGRLRIERGRQNGRVVTATRKRHPLLGAWAKYEQAAHHSERYKDLCQGVHLEQSIQRDRDHARGGGKRLPRAC